MKKLFLSAIFLSICLLSCKKDVPLQDETYVTKIYTTSKLPIVKVQINGVDKFLLLDTGASFTSLHTETIKQVGGVVGDPASISAEGFGGTEDRLFDAHKLKIKMGDTYLKTTIYAKDYTRIKEIIYQDDHVEIDGILGNDVISTNNFILNFKDNSITR